MRYRPNLPVPTTPAEVRAQLAQKRSDHRERKTAHQSARNDLRSAQTLAKEEYDRIVGTIRRDRVHLDRIYREERAVHEQQIEALLALAERLKDPRRAQRAREQLAEREAEILQNIPEDLHGIWEMVKNRFLFARFRNRSRTEAFLEWVQSNPEEVQEILVQLAEDRLERDFEGYEERLADSPVWRVTWALDANSGIFYLDSVSEDERSLAKRLARAAAPAGSDVTLDLVSYRNREDDVAVGAPIVSLHGDKVQIEVEGQLARKLPVWPDLFAANRRRRLARYR